MVSRTFGRYQVLDEIGDGAMGRVYRGFDPLVHRPVAIKTVKAELLSREAAEEYMRRFRREAQAAGTLSHPAIVSIYDVGDDYLVMEYLEGTTLQQLLKERGRLEVGETLRLLAPVADGLDRAHRAGVVHRDVKPANIMVLPDGRPKLMDFGVAHLDSTVMTATGQFLGSPSYMAPEQIAHGKASASSDLFSLAVLAYEVLTGERPFKGESITSIIYRVVNENPPPPRQLHADLPERYDGIFERALAKAPGSRFPSASAFVAALDGKEFAASLDNAVEAAPPTAPPPTPKDAEQPRVPAPSERRVPGARSLAGLGSGLVLAAAVTAAVYWRTSENPVSPPDQSVLAPTAASLVVETEPPGATVTLDHEKVGEAPLTLPNVTPGPHRVRVELEGFAPAEVSLDVSATDPPQPLRFVIQPVRARLDVDSVPPEANVRVDGRAMGRTPLAGLWLEPGTREIRLELPGHRPSVRRVEARAGEPLRVSARLEANADDARATAPPPPSTIPPLREGDLVEAGPEVTLPRKISGAVPSYPESARRKRLLGTVVVEMIVDEHGEPRDLRVIESAGEILDANVVAAVSRWRFEPARVGATKVKLRHQARFTFQE